MVLRSRHRLRATWLACALALAGCAQGPVVAPVVEVIVPPPPPISSSEPVVAEPEETPREPPKAKITSDLRPIKVRIVHTEVRQMDAELIQNRLVSLGATVQLYPTSDEGNEAHAGHLYIKSALQKYAPLIVRAIEDIEPEEIHQEDALEGDHNAVLWVVR